MKIVRPYAKIYDYSCGEPLQKIEWCGRISHRSEEAQTDISWKRFIEEVVFKHGDWSIVEHANCTVDALVDRGITHEWVRHRLFSYTQESTRFVNYEKKMSPSFIYPKPDVECDLCLADNEVRYNQASKAWKHWILPNTFGKNGQLLDCAYDPQWLFAIGGCEAGYKELLSDMHKWRPQEARSVFPNALASRIIVTGNLRNWRHFFIMRTTKEAHPQMRQVTIPLLAEFKTTFPVLFDDIEPMNTQVANLKLPR